MIKMGQICINKCHIDLLNEEHEDQATESTQNDKTSAKPVVRNSDQLLYLSDSEALCIESCSRMYMRHT